jgi:molybdopterin-guanine dinucleotide biosynthesis protein A
MAEENLYEFLVRRERELEHQISALRGQIELMRGNLAQRELELEQIKNFRAAKPSPVGGALPAFPQTNSNAIFGIAVDVPALAAMAAQNATVSFETLNALKAAETAHYQKMTIKELVIQALIDHFPNGGTANNIRDFIHNGYGRTIEPGSLRPQMHRLKADMILTLDANDIWNLDPRKRVLYGMYNHPTSRAAMKELQTDEPDENTMLKIGSSERYVGITTFDASGKDSEPKKGFDNPPFKRRPVKIEDDD